MHRCRALASAVLVLLTAGPSGAQEPAVAAPAVTVRGPRPATEAGPPAPSRDLEAWADYARALYPAPADCPSGRSGTLCIGFHLLRIEGDPWEGRLALTFEGENLSRNREVVPLLGSSETFTVLSVSATRPGGDQAPRVVLDLDAQQWNLEAAPGSFALRCEVGFEPRASLPLDVPGPVAELQSRLRRGGISFNEPTAWHGGIVLLQTGEDEREEVPVTVRVVRSFQWGAVPTFAYHFTVTGLKEQQELRLPMLGGERVELLEPERPHRLEQSELVVTLPPADELRLTALGHFAEAMPELAKPPGIPFEYWLLTTDVRHPVHLTTTGREIDPGAIRGINVAPGSRGFFLTGEQHLAIQAIAVEVDEGRGGSGDMAYLFVQGEDQYWVGNLDLTARVPRLDRLDVRTPEKPHYAERGGQAIRMFEGEDEALSVQLSDAAGCTVPLRIQWREQRYVNPFASIERFRLPAQKLHLDRQSVAAHFRPGFVPVWGRGADEVEGHLVDGFRMFALLMGLLAFVLCRAARFEIVICLVVAALFISLDPVEAFPRTALFILLAAVAALARLTPGLVEGVRRRTWLRMLLGGVFLILFLVAVIPLISFVRDRVYSALHPWAPEEEQVWADSYSSSYLTLSRAAHAPPTARGGKATLLDGLVTRKGKAEYEFDVEVPLGAAADAPPPPSEPEEGWAEYKEESKKRPRRKLAKPDVARALQQALQPQLVDGRDGEGPKEKSMRPVALDQPHTPGRVVTFNYRSVLPDQEIEAQAWVAGPWLRGIWIFAEAVVLLMLVFLIARGSHRLWSRRAAALVEEEEVTS